MKPRHCIALALVAHAVAQEPAPPVVVREEVVVPATPPVVIERVVPRAIPLDPALVRRQLAIAPKIIEVREEPAVVIPPGAKVETTETRTIVEEPGLPPRVYNVERNVVIVEGRELPYVTIPVLFVKETAELLDSESRVALEETAKAILEVLATSPDAGFDVEGHTSIEGTEDFNLKLSADRARRVYDELTKRYGVPVSAIGAHGFGEKYPNYPNGNEAEWALDRRVLVARVK
ncbi:OmpA family protein [Luteolibacter arcticus]|uniref:OmpA family protein n=1 Tax=Luteolibacter arcticus TaxID=1581411 RepID=A0ABT3GP43_9BACT|nr:OmpA family protein [Luteolibacter arcticus]MCW1925290.1 OmpA family protein [Luteolibacter arcticus]